jgi:hypothetical protein
MRRALMAILVSLACLSFAGAQTKPDAGASGAVKFTYVDVELDPNGHALGAYQFEFASETKGVTVVGIEAGQHPAFAKTPPYYDPAALKNNRVILAAFSTDSNLPKGKTVVARLDLMLEGDAAAAEHPQYATKLEVAADADGNLIRGATVKILEGAHP